MSSRQNRQPQRSKSNSYFQMNSDPSPYNNHSAGAQIPGGEQPRPSATLTLTRQGRIDGPHGGSTHAQNDITWYQQPAHNGFPNPSQSTIDSYQARRAQPQYNAPPTGWQGPGQAVHAGHPPGAYGENHETQGTSRAQGNFFHCLHPIILEMDH